MTSFYDFSATLPDGTVKSMADYRGKIVLVVNVASHCGFTPQYAGLERLWRTYRDQGFVVLGFPCNQFGDQEPGSAEEIAKFCSLTYDVTFPIFAKIDVNGEAAHPLFKYLKEAAPGVLGLNDVKWNFTKFLIGPHGEIMDRIASVIEPEDIEPQIKALFDLSTTEGVPA